MLTYVHCVTSRRCLQLNREKTELLGQLDDNDESAAETMRKYTALVKQVRTASRAAYAYAYTNRKQYGGGDNVPIGFFPSQLKVLGYILGVGLALW